MILFNRTTALVVGVEYGSLEDSLINNRLELISLLVDLCVNFFFAVVVVAAAVLFLLFLIRSD